MSQRWLVVYKDKWEPYNERREEITFHDDRQFQGPEAAAWEVAMGLTNHWELLRVEDLTGNLLGD
jgi:hypothetical protein